MPLQHVLLGEKRTSQKKWGPGKAVTSYKCIGLQVTSIGFITSYKKSGAPESQLKVGFFSYILD